MNDTPTPDDPTDTPDDHAEIDALARRAGAEVRRPAPAGLADGVRRARRRQQTVRAGLGAAGAVVLVIVGAAALGSRNGGDSIAPATIPETTLDETSATTLPDSVPEVTPTTVPTAEPTDDAAPTTLAQPSATSAPATDEPPSSSPATGVTPDAIYGWVSDSLTEQDVFDPITLEVVATRAAGSTPGDEPPMVSASGSVQYANPFEQTDLDTCNQSPVRGWVVGAEPTGLPARARDIVISQDGRVGAVRWTGCAQGTTLPDTVSLFDPEDPSRPSTELIAVDGSTSAILEVALSTDGSFALVTTSDLPLREGLSGTMSIIDTATADIVTEFGGPSPSGLPHGDCGWGFLSMQFVSPTALAYAAICPDEGVAVVVHDLVTGEGLDVVNPDYVGRTYETMVTARLEVDPATYSSASSAWYIMCAERGVDQGDGTVAFGPPGSRPCWLGHGDEEMREIPTRSTIGASFEPG